MKLASVIVFLLAGSAFAEPLPELTKVYVSRVTSKNTLGLIVTEACTDAQVATAKNHSGTYLKIYVTEVGTAKSETAKLVVPAVNGQDGVMIVASSKTLIDQFGRCYGRLVIFEYRGATPITDASFQAAFPLQYVAQTKYVRFYIQ